MMKSSWIAALLLGVIIAAGPFVLSQNNRELTMRVGHAWSAQSRQASCEASRKHCIAANVRTGSFGVRGVSPEASRRCWAAYRQCIGRH